MSEEKRKRLAEYDRNRYASMPEEKRQQMLARAREQRANMTEEQRKKVTEYLKKKRANMTAERRKELAEYSRKRRANMSEDRKKKMAEYAHKWYLNMAEEKRKQVVERARERRINLSEERRKQLAEHLREQRAKMPEEKKKKMAERAREQRANMSDEQRRKLAERARERRAKMSEEQRKKHDIKRRPDKQMNKKNEQIKVNMTETQILNEGYKLLKKLIKRLNIRKMNVDKLYNMPEYIFKDILKLFGINRVRKKNRITHRIAIRQLTYEIYIRYLIELLRRWDGWTVTKSIEHFSYDALFLYIKNNVLAFKMQPESFLPNELNDLFQSDDYITVSCSLKQLQSAFYHSPQNYVEINPENLASGISQQLEVYYPEHIIIWPFVSTQITLPNFSMSHQNNHLDEYTLFNLANGLKVDKNNNSLINQMMSKKKSTKYLKRNMAEFLNQLKNAIIKKGSGHLTIEKKAEVMMALSVFENDLAQCPEVLESHCKYNWSSALYPYARYLGYSDDNNTCISMSDQKAFKNPIFNVRLQQIRHPKFSFYVENFNVSYEIKSKEFHYAFNDRFLREVNSCISYNCLLCNESLGSSSPSRIISDHFSQYHGLEPDWECTNCFKYFTNNYLVSNHWKHNCET